MKKAVSLLMLSLTVTAGASGPKPAHAPIYLGFYDTDEAIGRIVDATGARNQSGDYERIQTVYDWIIKNCARTGEPTGEYVDWDEIATRQDAIINRLNSELDAGQAAIYSSFDALYTDEFYWDNSYNDPYALASIASDMANYRVGDCVSYSCLLAAMLGQLGYESYVIPGEFINRDGTHVIHKWNMVYVGDIPYYLDVRMDHSYFTSTGSISHTFFLKTDDNEWAARHEWNHAFTDAIKDLHKQGYSSYYYRGFDHANTKAAWTAASDWAVPYLAQAQNIGYIPEILQGKDMRQPITREEFAALAVEFFGPEEGDGDIDSPFTDCDSPDVLRAYSLGIVNGETETTFNPSGYLRREQAAAMLGRVIEAASEDGVIRGGSGLDADGAKEFADGGEISDYARNYVAFFSAQGIIDGVGQNRFDPWGTMTREAAIKIAVVTAEKYE